MAKHFLVASVLKVAFYLFLLTISIRCVSSARILSEDAGIVDTPIAPIVTPAASTPVTTPTDADIVDTPAASTPVTTPTDGVDPATSQATGAVGNNDHTHPPPLTFFMHDVASGLTPSTGIVANSAVNSQLPFSKSNAGVFPVNYQVPLLNGNTGITNNNNPLVTGLGNTNTLVGNNNALNTGSRLPFVTGGQVTAGSTLKQPMFGSITVIDDELTEGQELGSSAVGKVQGFYLASSQDGSSQTMALTVVLHGTDPQSDHDFDTISFFGVRQTAAPLSHIAVIGGTGKYENSKGYATIEPLHEVEQQTADGGEGVLKISIYLTP